MLVMRHVALPVCGVLLSIGLAWAVQASPAAASLVGVWRVSGYAITGPDAKTITNPSPGLRIFTRTHYSVTEVPFDRKRADLPEEREPTHKEWVEALLPFVAQAGTYEVRDNVITYHVTVAKIPNNMRPGSTATSTFKVEGDTLWLTLTAKPGGAVDNPITWKLTRVE